MTLLNTDMVSFGGGGGGKVTFRTVNASGAVLSSDQIIKADATAGAVVLTFTPAAQNSGQLVTIWKIDATANAVELNDGSGVIASLVAPAVGKVCQGLNALSDGAAITVGEVS